MTSGFFEQGGLLTHEPGHEPRPSQNELAAAVAKNMKARGLLIAEAPTGTGKSLAYLVPAVIASATGEKTLVVTANIALQEQLVGKDLPRLRATPGVPAFEFALLKGISNYLCKSQYDAMPVTLETVALRKWAEVTTTGDLSELEREPTAQVRRLATVSSDECTGKHCLHYDTCFAKLAKGKAAEADIVVTNYHMYFIHARMVHDGGDGIIPDYTHLVMDEGHAAPDIAREFFGSRVTRGSVLWAIRLLGGDDHVDRIDIELKITTTSIVDRFFQWLRTVEAGKRFDRRLIDPSGVVAALRAVVKAYRTADVQIDAGAAKVTRATTRCAELAASIDFALNNTDPKQYVHYIEEPRNERGDVSLITKQIDASALLKAAVFDVVGSKTVVSATLRAGGTFEFFRRELGMSEPTTELSVDTPFDLRASMILYIPPNMPEPNTPNFSQAACREIEAIVRAAKGRTLALFTSYKMLHAAHQWLTRARLPYRVLMQGEAPRTRLIEQFKADTNSVLLGTSSFWEGVDVQGEACSAVIIDKLPFDSITDPIIAAVNEANPKAFFAHMIPRAVIAFRQGTGRLIRSKTDRGLVAVLDPRLRTKGYGKQFLKDWPAGLTVTTNVIEAGAFVDAPRGET